MESRNGDEERRNFEGTRQKLRRFCCRDWGGGGGGWHCCVFLVRLCCYTNQSRGVEDRCDMIESAVLRAKGEEDLLSKACVSQNCSAITAREAPTASANVGRLVAPFRHSLQRVMSPSSIPGTDTAEGIVHAPNRAPKFAFYYRTKRNARGCDLSR